MSFSVYPGTKLSEVYQAGVSVVKGERPELEDKMTKTFGFAMGIEFREGSLVIGPKTNAPAKKGELLTSVIIVCFKHFASSSCLSKFIHVASV
jgi:nucleosome binding factor SPN SPT16 subunit